MTIASFESIIQELFKSDRLLEHLNEFLKQLHLSPNGFAFIVELDGNLIATSRGPHLRKGVGNDNTRLNAAQSEDPLLAATYKVVKGLTDGGSKSNSSRMNSFVAPDGSVVQAGYVRIRDKAGLDWIVAVAVPRNDFMQKVTDNIHRTAIMALLACALIVALGFAVLNIIARDLRQLAVAAKDMGDGVASSTMPIDRHDEIGDLAKSFANMQQRLLTDRLTGIANREAIIRRIEDRIVRQRRRGDSHPFAVFFVDLNGFKQINDTLGHDVGDAVLIEIGQRLVKSLRENDLAARYGGDEFVLLLDNVDNRSNVMGARDKLERVLAQPLQALLNVSPEAASIGAGAAIGMALCPDEGQDLESLLKRADEDMYLRKQAISSESTDIIV